MLAIKSEIAQSIAQTIKSINSNAELEASTVLDMLEYPPDEKMLTIGCCVYAQQPLHYKASNYLSSQQYYGTLLHFCVIML